MGVSVTCVEQGEKRPPAERGRCVLLTLTALTLLLLGAISTCYYLAALENYKLQNRYNDLSDAFNALQVSRGGACPRGWIQFGRSCYFKSPETNSWIHALYDCVLKEAHLVYINSREEQVFVATLSSEMVWIGLRSYSGNTTTDKWMWDLGKFIPEMWTSIQTGEPPTEYSGVVCSGHGQWTYDDPFFTLAWICEKPVSSQ